MNYLKNSILWIVILITNISWAAVNYNLELVSQVENITQFNSNANFGVSDVWGYTDETGIEYAIVGYRYGTFIYDVSTDPDDPNLVFDVSGPSGGDYYYHRDYKTYADHLYIVNEMWGIDEGVQIIDLSPLPESTPIKLDTYTGIDQSHNLWVDEENGYGFIEKSYPNNIHILDLTNPAVPLHVSDFTYDDGIDCHDIFTRGDYAYIAEGWSSQYGIYDISDITDPVRLATIPVYGYAHNVWLNTAGTHLITTEETVGITVKIWDIQDLGNINLVSGKIYSFRYLAKLVINLAKSKSKLVKIKRTGPMPHNGYRPFNITLLKKYFTFFLAPKHIFLEISIPIQLMLVIPDSINMLPVPQKGSNKTSFSFILVKLIIALENLGVNADG